MVIGALLIGMEKKLLRLVIRQTVYSHAGCGYDKRIKRMDV